MKLHIGIGNEVNLWLSLCLPVFFLLKPWYFKGYINLLSSCLNWKIYCNDHSSLSSTTAVQIWIILYNFIYFTSFHGTGRYELNKLTSFPMCGFLAQLEEHRTGIAEVTGLTPVEALIFLGLPRSNCFNWKIYCDDHSSLSKKIYK